jgi:hypothetical protein
MGRKGWGSPGALVRGVLCGRPCRWRAFRAHSSRKTNSDRLIFERLERDITHPAAFALCVAQNRDRRSRETLRVIALPYRVQQPSLSVTACIKPTAVHEHPVASAKHSLKCAAVQST